MTPAMPASHAPVSTPALSAGELAIAQSVLYAALFDYPLTLAQLRETLVESEQTATDIVAAFSRSASLRAIVEQQDGFFFPRNRSDLVPERRRRESRSRAFLARHRLLLRLVCAMPYVEMVALSGSVAHMNLEGHGDLDLFVITRGRRVWSVTVAIVVLAKLMRRRRTVCVNLVIADSALGAGPEDLFTASQIIHLKPLSGEATYRRFIGANAWVSRFYRNFHAAARSPITIHHGVMVRGTKRTLEALAWWPSKAIEAVCRFAYGSYLRRRAAGWSSPEQVHLGADCIKLHTQSHRRTVLSRYGAAISGL